MIARAALVVAGLFDRWPFALKSTVDNWRARSFRAESEVSRLNAAVEAEKARSRTLLELLGLKAAMDQKKADRRATEDVAS